MIVHFPELDFLVKANGNSLDFDLFISEAITDKLEVKQVSVDGCF